MRMLKPCETVRSQLNRRRRGNDRVVGSVLVLAVGTDKVRARIDVIKYG
jgi:hypothetical protein